MAAQCEAVSDIGASSGIAVNGSYRPVESPEKAASTMKEARDINQTRAMVNATGEEWSKNT